MFDPPSLPAAGWYPDPHRPGIQRWWNGRDWETAWDDFSAGDGLPGVGAWLAAAFTTALARWRATAMISFLTTVPSSVLFGIAIERLTDGVVFDGDRITGWTNDRLTVAIPLMLVGIFFTVVASIGITVLMLRTIDGEQPGSDTSSEFRLGWSAILQAVRVLPRMIGWWLVLSAAIAGLAVVVAGLMVLVLPLGVIALLVLIPFAIYMGIRLAFVGHSIVDRPGQPFTRSIEVTRGRWWGVFGRLLLLGVIVWITSASLQAVSNAANGTGQGFGQNQFEINSDGSFDRLDLSELVPAMTLWSVIVSAIIAMTIAVLATSAASAGLARLYRSRIQATSPTS